MIGIYSITNLTNNKIYIGQTVNYKRRISDHKSALRNNRHPNQHLQNAWNKDKENNFTFSLLEECSIETLDEKEQYYIKKYNSIDPDKGYNKESGGSLNKCMSEESRKKLSEAIMGHPVSAETIKKLKEANIGKHLSDETKKKMSEFYAKKRIELGKPEKKPKLTKEELYLKQKEAGKRLMEYNRSHGNPMKGKHPSEETRKKMSNAKTGVTPWNKGIPRSEEQKRKQSEKMKGISNLHRWKKVVDVTNNIIYDSVTIAEKETGIKHISACARGERNSAGGRQWKYI